MARLGEAVRKGLRSLFGTPNWDAPAWMLALGAWRRSHRRQFRALVALIVLLPILAFLGYRLYQLLPKPILTTVEVQAPGITPVGADGSLYPQPVTLSFTTRYADPRDKGPRHAARLDLINKKIAEGALLQPAHAGEWRWTDENTLRFMTDNDWPAGQQYTVTLDPKIFAAGVQLKDRTPSFRTPAIAAKLQKYQFYQNPQDPSIHQVVATLHFTHAVDHASLESHLHLGMRPSGASIDVEPEQYPFEVKYGKHDREAYVTSKPLTLPEQENFMTLTLDKGVKAQLGPSETHDAIEQKVRIPSVSTYFRVDSMQARIVRNEDNDPEQTLIIQFTDGVDTDAVANSIHAWILPGGHYWRRNEIDQSLIRGAQQLDLHGNPTEHQYAKLQSFRFKAPERRQILVQIPPGLVSQGKFRMSVPYTALLSVPTYPREANIVGDGALLSLSGDRTLSFEARGVPGLRVEVFRLLDDEVAHLVTQTRGDLKNADFSSYQFDENDIAKRFVKVLPLNAPDPSQAAYSSLDLSDYLAQDGVGRGMFVVNVQGWDPQRNRIVYGGARDRRFVMVTDLGVLAKDNNDKTHDLFVHSLAGSGPVANARVELLGRNGLPVITRTTDARGHASIPDVSDFENGSQPVVYLVRHGGDTSFLPFNRPSRQLDFSRFDVGGLRTAGNRDRDQLHAVVFSDRGMYRPGESGHLAAMIKRSDWQDVTGAPVEITLTNPRGNVVKRERMALPADGFVELPLHFGATDPTGHYQAAVYLLNDRDVKLRQLGGASVDVEEFQPDTMRIHTEIAGGGEPAGWRTPMQYEARVKLENLFGLPAQKRRVQGEFMLSPTRFSFPQYAGFVFEDPYRDSNDRLGHSVRETLPETRSDTDGKASFKLDLSGYGKGLYRLSFEAEGYESGGGRSVSAGSSIRVSPAERLVGWKADGNLNYLHRHSEHVVHLVAVDPNLKSVAADGLTVKLIEQRPVSTLVRQNDGTLAYQTVTKSVPVSSKSFAIQAGGSNWTVPTDKPGDFAVTFEDADGHALAHFTYQVSGANNIAGGIEKNAELRLDLDRKDYKAGDEIEVQITAPYTGSGLITIERDHVYAYRWFHADTRRSVQHIRVPEGLEGNGYVNVTFVRSLDSPEIFTQPLSYAVEPFNVDRSKRTVDIQLDAPQKVKPGDTLTVQYRTSRPARMVLFAVDEGILQVAKYQTPQPLDAFLKKRALEVGTSQMADLLLPEFKLLRDAAAAGGGEAKAMAALGKNLNPFQRGVKAPVVYWSGIVQTTGKSQSLSFEVPDYFDGQLRVMAVAAAPTAAGSADTRTLVRGPFVLQPNVITMAAPGDEFTVSVGVTNALPADSKVDRVKVALRGDAHVKVVGSAETTLTLGPGKEGRATFKVRATDTLGGATLHFDASAGGESLSRSATLSVRPAVAYRSSVSAGTAEGDTELTLPRQLRPELAKQQAVAGYSPLILADGLTTYLEHYPHGCSEQIVSQVFPVLGLLDDPALALDAKSVRERYQNVVNALRGRQRPDGGFAFWPGQTGSNDFVSIYVMHFLTDAEAAGFVVPQDMKATGLDHLRKLAAVQPGAGDAAYRQAYAIYVLTRNGIVTTNYLTRLQEYLQKSETDKADWKKSLAAAYMAAAYQQLKLDDLADSLIGDYTFAEPGSDYEWDMDSALARNAQYIYLLARHFPNRLSAIDDARLQKVIAPIGDGRFNTLSSAYAVLALGAWGEQANHTATGKLSIKARQAKADWQLLTEGGGPVQRHAVPLDTPQLAFHGDADQRLFYSATQSGYDAALPDKVVKDDMEIVREYVDDNGKVVTSAKQGEELTVRIRVRALDNLAHPNVAIVDLLPGGFEVQRDSVRRRFNGWDVDYVDIREDRVVYYTTVTASARTLTYRVKVTGAGKFAIPPAHAASMYHRDVQAQSLPGTFTVELP